MPQNLKKRLADMTTDQVMARLFPKPVIKRAKDEANPPSKPPKEPPNPSMKE